MSLWVLPAFRLWQTLFVMILLRGILTIVYMCTWQKEDNRHKALWHTEKQRSCHGFVNLLWDNTTILNWLVVCSLLHKTPLVQPQPAGLSWAAQRHRLHVHSPSRSSVVETPRTWTTVDVRLSMWRHVPSHASAHAIPRLARVLRDTFRSYVTSPFRLSTGLLTNPRRRGSQISFPASWLYPSRLLLLLRRRPCLPDRCVGCIFFFLPHASRCKTLCTHGQYQSQSGVYTQ